MADPRALDLRDRLIIALDLPTVEEAAALVARIGPAASFYKIGLELVCAGGLPLVERLVGEGKEVFVDLKLHDIPNTVERATARIAALGATYLTVHAYPQTMAAAVRGSSGSGLLLLAVTVLTSMTDEDLAQAGYAERVDATVLRRARQAQVCGVGGLVLSPRELVEVRAAVGPEPVLVTPGVRPAGSASADQERVATPGAAIAAGADHLVVGRPITAAADPRAAAQGILDEIADAVAALPVPG